MKKYAFFVVLLLITVRTFGQSGTIKGKVVTDEKIPIPNVNITIGNTGIGTMTNDKGEYQINGIRIGNYVIKASYVGFAPRSIEVNVVGNTTTTVADFVLQEKQEELNEVVVEGHQNNYITREPSTSLRLKTEIAKLPQNIQVISAALLQDQQATSIMDGVIRNVSGVTMLEHWGHFARINMRGFRLPAFRNGVNVQDSWGPLSEDMAFVDRLEFVKGPSGFMMSAGEPGGFYNVVTKKPSEEFIGNVSVSGGSFDFFRGSFDLGGKLSENGKLLYRFNALYQTGDSHRGNEDAERWGVAPALTYKFSERTKITTELNLQKAESYIGSAYIFAPVSDGYASLDRNFKFTDTNYPATDIQELSLFTNLKHDFSDNWGVETQFAYMRYNQEGQSFWAWSITDEGDADRRVTQWDALSVGKYFQTYLYGNFKTGGVSHNLLGGFDYTQKTYWADFSNTVAIDQTPFNIYNPIYGNSIPLDFDRSVAIQHRNGGVPYNGNTLRAYYLQDEIGFWEDKVRLTLAGRYTELVTRGKEEQDSKFSPRIGLSVDIMPTLAAFALYDQSFLPANGVDFNGDTFDPIEANDIEGGIKKSFFNGMLKTSLGAFLITKQNVLVTDTEHPDFSIQLGEVQSKGIEFDLQGELTPELNVILNYANTNVEITEDTDESVIGQRVAGHAKHVTNGWLNYNFAKTSMLKGFGASLGYQYQVDRSTWAWGADSQSDLPNYFRLDGALSWKNDKLRVQLNLNNILDEYLYAGANYGTYLYWQSEPGINGRATITYSF
ncbi:MULTISPECIES: TonB-dependent receptor [unclassified Arenibacter]|uniref:TonB-dependent receptor n=1 Tax=unclassified Arenibacter TaxID=2615047 RepID=UPI000E34836D|nr:MULTISPECIES: TonB-dependent receptor [unclassified Arenibacter]MCM4164681.1 TonB-dependent siderophore receptor [Arenibacter sp. A80]RFT55757.1 TonB-dependent receptor [Arenibacter sp. P308M17]